MRIYSWNVNGVRAATKKGLFDWLEHESPDILCIQETKAHVDQLGSEILKDHGYHAYWHSGERRGYSGVATFCKDEPLYVQEGLGIEKYDTEGRVLLTEHEGFLLYNIYFPNGQKDDIRLKYKLDFYDDLLPIINDQVESGNNVIVANNVPLGGHVTIEDSVVIGGNSAVQQFTRIGRLAMIGGMTGVLKDVIPFGLSIGNRNYLQGLNLIGLRRKKYENQKIMGLSKAYKEIFASKNLHENLSKINGEHKGNDLVKEVITFIEKDKKRPICSPKS